MLTDGTLTNVYGLGLSYSVGISNTVQVMHTDGLGSVRALTDGSGNVTETFQTDEFGNATLTQGTSGEPFRYTGQQKDPETGFYDLRARYYWPTIGRFVSRDGRFGSPASPLSLNRYSYVEGNPATLVDPSGLAVNCPEEACGGVGPEIGASGDSEGSGGSGLDTGAMGPAGASNPGRPMGDQNPSVINLDSYSSETGLDMLGSAGLDPETIRIPGPTNSIYGKIDYTLGNVTYNEDSVGKGGFFRGVMGFDEETIGPALRSHLIDNFDRATLVPNSKYGNRLEVTGTMTGPNGTIANVKTVWQYSASGTINYVTAWPN